MMRLQLSTIKQQTWDSSPFLRDFRTGISQKHCVIVLSIVVYGEIMEYLKGFTGFPRHQSALRTLLRKVYPYPLTYALLEQYADLRRAMRPPYGPGLIGDIDTLIAATALHYGLTLVTTDSDFTRVPALSFMHLPLHALRG
jgi:predicted nucleic acid-binding protein